MPLMAESDRLVEALERLHAGDSDALGELVTKLHPWLHGYVRRKMGQKLRAVDTSLDVVQDVLVKVLTKGPRFIPATRDQLRIAQRTDRVITNPRLCPEGPRRGHQALC